MHDRRAPLLAEGIMQEARTYYAIGKRDAYAELCALVRIAGFKGGVKQIADELLKAQPDHPHALAIIEGLRKSREEEKQRKEAEQRTAEERQERLTWLERRLRDLTRIIWFGDLVDPWTRDRQKFWAAQGEKLVTDHDVEPPRLPSDEKILWCVAIDMTNLVHILLVDVHAVPPHGLRPLRQMQRETLPLSWKSIETWKRWSTFMPFFNTPGKAWHAAEIALKEANLEQLGQRLGI
jgi:hypothetical protein